MECEYVVKNYGVPACIGRRVIACGEPGIIAEDRGNYIGVNLDSSKPGIVNNYHPTYKIEYLGMGKIRKMTPGQKRYKEYLDAADCFDSFKQFLGYTEAKRKGLVA